MGTYSEFKFKAKLRLPAKVEELLQAVVNGADVDYQVFKDYAKDISEEAVSFFDCERAFELFHGKNCEEHPDPALEKGQYLWTLSIHSEFKNYDNEIDKFITFITPYVSSRKKKIFVGSTCIENYADTKRNIYIERYE